MTEEQSAQVPMDISQVPMPPVFEQFLGSLKNDRKRLLKEKAFADPAQLRAFIGQFLYPRLTEMVRLFASVSMEAYGIAASNSNELRRLHYFTVTELNRLGAELDEEEAQLPGVSANLLNEFQQAFYGLGTHLQEKYPDDTDTQAAYNRVAETVSRMVGELMDDYDEGDDGLDDDDLDDDEGDLDDDGEIEDVDLDADESGADEEPEAKEKTKTSVAAKKSKKKAEKDGEGSDG